MGKKKPLPMHREKYASTSKKLECPPLAAFDFETDGLGGKFLVAAIWTSDMVRELFTSLTDFFDWMLNHPQYRFLAHNACGYEFAYMAPLIYDHFANNDNVDIRPTIQGDSRIVQFCITITDPETKSRRGKPAKTVIDIRDTLCLFSMSLARVADAFCPELPKMKEVIDFEHETWNINNPLHVEYVFRDCEIVLMAYQRHWQNIVEAFGTPLGVTAGSTALKAFKATIPEGHVYYRVNEETEQFIRLCYYGGLVLPGHTIGSWGSVGSVDVNGAYAFQMASHMYPVGNPFSTHRYHPDMVGFYHVIATVPSSVYRDLGFNPVPCKDGQGRGLSWPTGTFHTYITSPEIDYAREKGCTIDIVCGYVFPRQESIFGPFIQTCQNMELYDGGRYKPSIKQIRNSGYGKFGSKQTHKTIRFSKETLVDFEPVLNEDTGQEIPFLYLGEDTTEADYMMPHWAALITAYERLYLMRFMEEAYKRGAKNVYCDTDSIKCDLSVLTSMVVDGTIPVGNHYGEFKVEETCHDFILLGSKCFFGDTGFSDKALVKAKGLPKKVALTEGGELIPMGRDIYQKALEDERNSLWFTSVKSVMSIIKEKSRVKPIQRNRRITDLRNSWAWVLSKSDGRIYPRGYPIPQRT